MSLKKIVISCILALAISLPVFANHDDESTIYNKDSLVINAWGYAYVSGEVGKGNLMAYPMRGRIKVRYKEHWLAFAEVDISHFMQQNAPDNPVTQAWVGYDFGKEPLTGNMFRNTVVSVGSILTAGGVYIPPAYMALTVTPPINPFGHYANGGKFQTEVIPGVTVTADVTGRTEAPIYDWNKRMSRTETSQSVNWVAMKNEVGKPTLVLSIFNAMGFGENSFQRNGITAMWSPTTKLDLYAGAFRSKERISTEKTLSEIGGFVLADYELYKVRGWLDFDVRAQAMVEKTSGWRDYTAGTGGLSLTLNGEKYGRQNGSKIMFNYTVKTTQIEGGPKVNDNVPGISFLIFF